MKTKLMILTIFLAFASFMAANYAYSAMEDRTDRLSDEQSGIFSPGYINASKQKTDAIIGQLDPKKSFMDKLMESVQSKVSNKVADDASEMVKPELKRKTSAASEGTSRIAAGASGTNLIDSTQYNVNIGSGTDKVYQNNRLISEVIDGIRHVYAGFSNVGTNTIQDAINRAHEGDMIIVKGREFTEAGVINVKNGVKLFGGYDETGHRDIIATPTTVNGAFRADAINRPTEINGFTIYKKTGAGIYFYDCTDALRIINNNISASYGIGASNSRAVIYNNFIHGTFAGINTIKSSSITVVNNIIEGGTYGIWENNSSSIYANNVIRNSGIGIRFQGAQMTTMDHNTIYGSGTLINGDGYALRLTDNVLISDKTFFGTGVHFVTVQDNIFGREGKFYADQQCTTPTVNLGKAGYSSNSSTTYPYPIPPPEGQEQNPAYNPSYNQNYAFQTKWINDFSYQNIIYDAKNAIDPTQGLYSISGKGYLSDNINADYGKMTIASPITAALTNTVNNSMAQSNYWNSFFAYNMSENKNFISMNKRAMDNESLSSIFKGLLANKDSLMTQGQSGTEIDSALIKKLLTDTIKESALSIQAIDLKSAQMEAALALANIMKNPTEDQKMMLDAVTALLSMVNNINAQNENPDLKKAEDNLLQAVASIMLAQAIPDLLKEGDVANIKSIFADLGANKGKIMLEYQESTKPYYDNIIKGLSKNIQLLQLKNILSKNMTQEELEKLSRSDLDKIMEKLKSASNKSFEEEYMLQQEAKYRKQYIDPNKKMLEDKMKDMMRDFTRRLSGVLEGVKSEKK